jgi:hypothetical protein
MEAAGIERASRTSESSLGRRLERACGRARGASPDQDRRAVDQCQALTLSDLEQAALAKALDAVALVAIGVARCG